MKFVIEEQFSRPFFVLRMLAEYTFNLAQAIAVVGAFTYVYQVSQNQQMGIFLYILRNVVFVYIFAWPLTAFTEIGRIYPAGPDGKYDVPTWLFCLIIIVGLALNLGSFYALTSLPQIIAPLLKS